MSHEEDKSHDGDQSGNSSSRRRASKKLEMQALLGEMKRLLQKELEPVHTRLDNMENSIQQGQPDATQQRQQQNPEVRERRTRARQERSEEELDYYSQGSHASVRSRRRPRRDQEARRRDDNNLSGLKSKIPPFHGKNDPDAYLEWEEKIELVFDCQTHPDYKKEKICSKPFSPTVTSEA